MADGQILFVRGEKSATQEEKSGGDSTTGEDDVWDDTALVQAYDRAVSLAKEEVARRMGLSKETGSGNESNSSNKTKLRKKKSNKKELHWNVGDPCLAPYSVDGMFYEGTIDALFPDKGTCVVTYVGYGNKEEVLLKMLRPSAGQATRKMQALAAAQELQAQSVQNGLEMDCSDEESLKNSSSKPQVRTNPKSPQGNRMDWESRSVKPPGPNCLPSNLRSFRMPPMGLPPMAVPPPPPPHLTNSYPEDDSEALSAMLMSWYMSGFHTGYYQGLKQARSLSHGVGNTSRNSSRKK